MERVWLTANLRSRRRETSDVRRERANLRDEEQNGMSGHFTFRVSRLSFIVFTIHYCLFTLFALCHALMKKPVVIMITPSHNMPI